MSTAAVATGPTAQNQMVQLFEPAREHFRRLATEERFMKEVGFAASILAGNDYLNKGTNDSKIKALMALADVPLTLNPIQRQAYLVPRKVGGVLQCILEPSYIGLVKLLTDSGSVRHIEARPIFQGDDCAIDLSSAAKVLKHVPYFMRGVPRGNVMGFYSLATLNDGSKVCEPMGKDEVDKIMERSESYRSWKRGDIKSCTWATDYDEMGRKTVIRRHWKQLPKTERMEHFAKAVDLDNQDYTDGSQLASSSIPAAQEPTKEQRELESLKDKVRQAIGTYKGDDRKELKQACVDAHNTGVINPAFWQGMLDRLSKPAEPEGDPKLTTEPAIQQQ